MVFHERLKALREDIGFTQQHLAEVLNLSSGAVSHYENGTNEPTIETLIRIADVLNVSVDYLVGNADANLPPNEMKKPYCKGVSTDSLIQRAIQLDQSHRQELNYFLKCIELEQFISSKGSNGKRNLRIHYYTIFDKKSKGVFLIFHLFSSKCKIRRLRFQPPYTVISKSKISEMFISAPSANSNLKKTSSSRLIVPILTTSKHLQMIDAMKTAPFRFSLGKGLLLFRNGSIIGFVIFVAVLQSARP